MNTEIRSGPNSNIPSDELRRISETLRLIEEKDGNITPRSVLLEARQKHSPLHRYFEWDDGEAAEKYRLWQARELIAKVYVVDKGRPELPPVRAFVNVRTAPQSHSDDQGNNGCTQAYMSITRLESRADLQAQVLAYAMSQLVAWRKRYGHYHQFLKIASAIDSLQLEFPNSVPQS